MSEGQIDPIARLHELGSTLIDRPYATPQERNWGGEIRKLADVLARQRGKLLAELYGTGTVVVDSAAPRNTAPRNEEEPAFDKRLRQLGEEFLKNADGPESPEHLRAFLRNVSDETAHLAERVPAPAIQMEPVPEWDPRKALDEHLVDLVGANMTRSNQFRSLRFILKNIPEGPHADGAIAILRDLVGRYAVDF